MDHIQINMVKKTVKYGQHVIFAGGLVLYYTINQSIGLLDNHRPVQ